MKGRVAVIGAGVNGLVAAACLARAGLAPVVLERRSTVGGCAATGEFHPGFRAPLLAHAAGPVRPGLAADLGLAAHGLRTAQPDPFLLVPSLAGGTMAVSHRGGGEAIGVPPPDAARYRQFVGTMARAAALVDPFLTKPPPALAGLGAGDLWGLFRAGRSFRAMGRADASRLLRWLTMPAADLVAEWFEDERLRAAVAAPALWGAFAGPKSPGTGALILLHAAIHGHPAGPGTFYPGGPMLLVEALAAAARSAGAVIRTGEAVARVEVRNGRLEAIVLESGTALPIGVAVSSLDPRRTLGLVDPGELDPAFREQVRQYRCRGVTAKLNLALSGLPRFRALEEQGMPAGGAAAGGPAGRIQIGPSLDYLERAFDPVKYGRYAEEPLVDLMLPSLADPGLAPPGCHVLSACVQFAPYRLAEGTWADQRDRFADLVVQTLEAYAPGLRRMIVGRQVLSPLDLESEFGLTGGHIHHGELAADQLFGMRPLYGWSRYRLPIQGLYLCGAGTHAGIGMTGDSGANASREVVKDLRA